MAEISNVNHCGNCTMCCKLPGVAELAKPVNAWCVHCNKGKGCGIYETRPVSCREFACTWLLARTKGMLIEDALRPDRCHVVLDQREVDGVAIPTVMAHVDPAHPEAWRSGPVMRLIADMAGSGSVVALSNGRYRLIVDHTGIYEAVTVATREGVGLDIKKGRKIGRVASKPGMRPR